MTHAALDGITVVQEGSRSAVEYWCRLAVVGRNEPELRCESKTSLQRSYQLDLKVDYLLFMVASRLIRRFSPSQATNQSCRPAPRCLAHRSKVARPRSTR